jgi:carboxyl-terminal processing protease
LTIELEKIDHKAPATKKRTNEHNASKTEEDKTIITQEQLYKDAQLKSATDILKVLIITNTNKEVK